MPSNFLPTKMLSKTAKFYSEKVESFKLFYLPRIIRFSIFTSFAFLARFMDRSFQCKKVDYIHLLCKGKNPSLFVWIQLICFCRISNSFTCLVKFKTVKQKVSCTVIQSKSIFSEHMGPYLSSFIVTYKSRKNYFTYFWWFNDHALNLDVACTSTCSSDAGVIWNSSLLPHIAT